MHINVLQKFIFQVNEILSVLTNNLYSKNMSGNKRNNIALKYIHETRALKEVLQYFPTTIA